MVDNHISKLHTAARRYCMDRYCYWNKQYDVLCKKGNDRKSDGYNYTDEALNVFPRYNIVNAILIEVEKFTPASFKSLDEAKELLKISGEIAETIFTKPPYGDIEEKVMTEERKLFVNYINGLSISDLEKIEELPYSRILSNDENIEIWKRAQKEWHISDEYWFPLDGEKRKDLLAFQENYFFDEFGIDLLKKILKRNGIEKVYEFREDNTSKLVDLDIFKPIYSIEGEGFFFTSKYDWIIYASHESSITIGGEWLISEIKRKWKNWEERLWKSYFETEK